MNATELPPSAPLGDASSAMVDYAAGSQIINWTIVHEIAAVAISNIYYDERNITITLTDISNPGGHVYFKIKYYLAYTKFSDTMLTDGENYWVIRYNSDELYISTPIKKWGCIPYKGSIVEAIEKFINTIT